jgi:hypothetical protein
MPLRRMLLAAALATAVSATGCGPSLHQKVHQPFASFDSDCCPLLIPRSEPAPVGAALVAEVGYGETGFSLNCSYPQNMERLRIEACRLGADAVKIVAENHPNMVSTCYRVRAALYRLHAGLDSEPERQAASEAPRGRCPSAATRRFQPEGP